MKFRLLTIMSMALIAAGLSFSSCKKDSPRRVSKNHRKSVGASAHDLLSNDKYTSMVVEIQYMKGFQPSSEAVDAMRSFFNARLSKSKGIAFVYTEIPAQGKGSYSLDDVVAIENASRTQFTSRKEIALYFLFLDGNASTDTQDLKTVGEAYYNTSMAVFQKTVLDNTGGVGQADEFVVEATVITHEIGHLLGLVDLGSDMQNNHVDGEHANHCINEDCLMYWLVGSGSMIGNMLGTQTLPTLDANCLADLHGNGGK